MWKARRAAWREGWREGSGGDGRRDCLPSEALLVGLSNAVISVPRGKTQAWYRKHGALLPGCETVTARDCAGALMPCSVPGARAVGVGRVISSDWGALVARWKRLKPRTPWIRHSAPEVGLGMRPRLQAQCGLNTVPNPLRLVQNRDALWGVSSQLLPGVPWTCVYAIL